MFLTISLKALKQKWRTILKIIALVMFLCYVLPKIVLAVSGICSPPPNEKLRDAPLKQAPMKVEALIDNA